MTTPPPVSAPERPASLADVLLGIEPMALAEVENSIFADRIDTKYLIPARAAARLIEEARAHYAVVETGGLRFAPYSNEYFDTPSRRIYHDHHSQRFPRFKIRVRSYHSGDRFLEVKRRDRGGRTRKYRLPVAPGESGPLDVLERENPLEIASFVPIREVEPVVTVRYRRVALIGTAQRERVTVDLELACDNGRRSHEFEGVGIVEIKQGSPTESPFAEALRGAGIRRTRLSKYCVCLATLEPELKQNRFRSVLDRMTRLGESRGLGTP